MRLSLYHKAIAILSVTFLIQIGLCLRYGHLVDYVENLEEMEARSRTVIGHLNWLSVLVDNAVIGKMGESSGNDSDGKFAKLFAQAESGIPHQITDLQTIFRTSPIQLERVNKLQESSAHLLEYLRTHKSCDFSDPAILAITSDIPRVRREILAEEKQHENVDPVQALPQARRAVQSQIAYGVGFNIVAALILIFIFVRKVAFRLSVISENSLRLTRREKLLEPLKGKDEIAELDTTLHSVAVKLQEMAKRERAIIDNAVDVICSISEDGKFIEVSPASEKQWGVRAPDLAGKSLVDLISADTIEETKHQMQRCKSELMTVVFENKLVKRGAVIDTLWTCGWSKDERAFFCVAHDITERKEMDLLKQQFVAMVGHDLRSPLTSIQVYFDSITSGVYGEVSDSILRFSKLALRNTERLIALVNDLLDIEKIESGTFQMNYASVDLDAVLGDSIETMRELASQRKVVLRQSEGGARVNADPERLIQVFVNLISNAIKYSPENGVVEINTENVDADQVEISFRDQGRGVPKEYQKIIFDRFKQVEQSDNVRGKGTGLGLAICKAIVDQHKGAIGVDSEPGKGSRFWVRLPLEPVQERV